MPQLRIDIWSDIACPWCYVGKRHLEQALGSFPEAKSVEIVWHAFELNPSAARETHEGPYAERLAKKYGMSPKEAQSRIDHLVSVGKSDGLTLDFERIRPGNTFDAHRIVHYAREAGKQDAVKERFLRGYLSEGEAIGDPAVVARLAVDAGLDAERVSAILASDEYAREVRTDEAEAHRLGIHGVPFFVVGGRYALSGAQPAELMGRALQQAWSELAAPVEFGEGAACGPDGC
ncbi:MAG TPA: DsbA family oxidoreductase [Polyangiaceae bacterium]|nr:DsbA family oxidoreductase [Polyangiaceae bacterium]